MGKALLNLIDGANNTIHFAIYGVRNQPRILDALIIANKRGVSVFGILHKDIYNDNYYSDIKNARFVEE